VPLRLVGSEMCIRDSSKRVVKLGLTDFQKAEIVSGLTAKDQVIKPE
jgi:hypothetical protein